MSRKTRQTGLSGDVLEDAGLFADEDFEVEAFLRSHDERKASHRKRQRKTAMKRLEEERDWRALRRELQNWGEPEWGDTSDYDERDW